MGTLSSLDNFTLLAWAKKYKYFLQIFSISLWGIEAIKYVINNKYVLDKLMTRCDQLIFSVP